MLLIRYSSMLNANKKKGCFSKFLFNQQRGKTFMYVKFKKSNQLDYSDLKHISFVTINTV